MAVVRNEPTSAQDSIAKQVVDAGIAVHSVLGPGLLESVYERCLARELETRNLSVVRQADIPLTYRGEVIDIGFRLDLLVGGSVVVEVKAVQALTSVHEAQLLTYLKLSGYRLGFLMNFNVTKLKDGLRRFVAVS